MEVNVSFGYSKGRMQNQKRWGYSSGKYLRIIECTRDTDESRSHYRLIQRRIVQFQTKNDNNKPCSRYLLTRSVINSLPECPKSSRKKVIIYDDSESMSSLSMSEDSSSASNDDSFIEGDHGNGGGNTMISNDADSGSSESDGSDYGSDYGSDCGNDSADGSDDFDIGRGSWESDSSESIVITRSTRNTRN